MVNGERWRVLRKRLAHRGLDGLCHLPPRREIHLARGLSPRDLEDTFLHELIHACLSSRWNARTEERLVTKLTPRLLAALKDAGWIK